MKRLVLLLALLVASPAFGQANLKGDVTIARAKYPTPMSPAQQAAVVNEVAWKHRSEGWGVLSKPDGNNCPQPVSGRPISCDFLVFKSGSTLVGFDVLVAAEGAGTPTWDGPQGGLDVSRFVAPTDAGDNPPPPPPPPGDAATADLQRQQLTLLMQIVQKQGELLELQRQQAGELKLAIEDLKRQIASGVKIKF